METLFTNCNNMHDSKVILLGLPKCGLSSFTEALRTIGYNVAFWVNDKNEFFAELVFKAYSEGKKLLHYLSEYDAITQMDLISIEKSVCLFPKSVFYKELYEQCPDSKFILNYRNIEHHVRSICNWKNMQERFAYFNIPDIGKFIESHNEKIRAFYKGKPNFLEFDIENDSLEKLSQFLNVPVIFPHANKTVCTRQSL